MKLKILLNVFILLISTQILNAQNEKLTVKVVQFGKEIKAINSVYKLKRDEFSLQFNVENTNDFLIGSTFDEDIYRSAKGEADLEVAWFGNTGMAEGIFNDDKQILVSNDAPSYWYFDNKNDHRFDKNPMGNSKKWTATRTINNFYDLNNDKQIEVKNCKESLYLVFYKNNNDVDKINEENGPDANLIKILSHLELNFND